mmetsp:Transcript_19084/g.49258  ORF Transcript_19084/g.49258 Transcript_19084/m.49258 type:complete len:179 (+) Transcript_19084:359-895(+)
MKRLTFKTIPSSTSVEAAAERIAHAAADSDGAFRSARSARLPAQDDVPPADAALLQQDGADNQAQPVSVLGSPGGPSLKGFIDDAIAAGDDVLALGLKRDGSAESIALRIVSVILIVAAIGTAAHCSGCFPLRAPASRPAPYAVLPGVDDDSLRGYDHRAASNALTGRLGAIEEGKSA